MAQTSQGRRGGEWLVGWYSKLLAVPVVTFAGAFLADWSYSSSFTLQWLNFSAWLLLAGLVGGVAAWLVLVLLTRLTGGSWLGALVLGAALIVETINFMVHMRDGRTAVVPAGLLLSLIGAVGTCAAAWFTRRSTVEARS